LHQNRRGQAGWRALRNRRLRDFDKLSKLRGRFRKGVRNNAAFYYCLLLAQCGLDAEKAKRRLAYLNESFSPPLNPAALSAALESAYTRKGGKLKYGKLKDQTIADWLNIEPIETAELECKLPASRYLREDDTPAPRLRRCDKDRMRMNQRRAAIQDHITSNDGQIPSCRSMAKLLADKGIKVGHVTIRSDYMSLGYTGERGTVLGD
jgi:hypothetical protein